MGRTEFRWEVATAKENCKTGFRVVMTFTSTHAQWTSTILQGLNGHITVTIKTIIDPHY